MFDVVSEMLKLAHKRIAELERTVENLRIVHGMEKEETTFLGDKVIHLERKTKCLTEENNELRSSLQNTIIELETYKHDALLWSMVDSPLLREQAQKLLDKKQEEAQEIEY